MYTVDVDMHGPVFDGRAALALAECAHEIAWEIGKVGRGDLGVQFIKVFKHPTGYYESKVELERPRSVPGGAEAVIHDNGVVYGPWLEGTGSRNYPVTRFKGYHSNRIVAQELERKATPIAELVLDRYLPAMGGGI